MKRMGKPTISDPFAPSSEEDSPIDLTKDLSSDPMYDFGAAGWTYNAAEDVMEPPAHLR
jgi:hypothetical protein